MDRRGAGKYLPVSGTDSSGRRDEGDSFGEEFEEEERALKAGDGPRVWSLDDGPFKLVLIVNMELKMGKGKVKRRYYDGSRWS